MTPEEPKVPAFKWKSKSCMLWRFLSLQEHLRSASNKYDPTTLQEVSHDTLIKQFSPAITINIKNQSHM